MINFIQRLTKRIGMYDLACLVYLKILAMRYAITLKIENMADVKVVTLRRGNQLLKIAHGHQAYGGEMVRFFNYYFNAVEPQEIGSDLVVDYSAPREHCLKGNGLSFYFLSLAESCETTDIYIKCARLEKGAIAFDLGAYCGASTQAFSQAVGKGGQVYAFEPDPQNYAAFLQNIARHKMTNVTAIPQGVWSKETELEFLVEGNIGSCVHTFLDRPGKTNVVSVTTIPNVVLKYNLDRLDFIKMDIEGAEVEVLSAALDVLKKFTPRLVIEPHRIQGIYTTTAVCNLLSSIGYTCEIVSQGELDLPLIYGYIEKR